MGRNLFSVLTLCLVPLVLCCNRNFRNFEETNEVRSSDPIQRREILEGKTFFVDPAKIKFLCHVVTSANSPESYLSTNVQEIIHEDRNSLKEAKLDARYPTKILIHGFTSNASSIFPLDVISGYNLRLRGVHSYSRRANSTFSQTDRIPYNYNIIAVDWSEYSGKAHPDDSPTAVRNEYERVTRRVIKPLSEIIFDFLVFLKLNGRIKSFDHVHLIGHSLGAHIAGRVGRTIKLNGLRLGRISALDPANLVKSCDYNVTNVTNEFCLVKEDAKFVDVIHTELHMLLGERLRFGHVDIYPNKGTEGEFGWYWNKDCDKVENRLLQATCYHSLAHRLYAFSIMDFYKKSQPVAYRCDNPEKEEPIIHTDEKVVYGEFLNDRSSGTFCMDVTKLPSQELTDLFAAVDEMNWRPQSEEAIKKFLAAVRELEESGIEVFP